MACLNVVTMHDVFQPKVCCEALLRSARHAGYLQPAVESAGFYALML